MTCAASSHDGMMLASIIDQLDASASAVPIGGNKDLGRDRSIKPSEFMSHVSGMMLNNDRLNAVGKQLQCESCASPGMKLSEVMSTRASRSFKRGNPWFMVWCSCLLGAEDMCDCP